MMVTFQVMKNINQYQLIFCYSPSQIQFSEELFSVKLSGTQVSKISVKIPNLQITGLLWGNLVDSPHRWLVMWKVSCFFFSQNALQNVMSKILTNWSRDCEFNINWCICVQKWVCPLYKLWPKEVSNPANSTEVPGLWYHEDGPVLKTSPPLPVVWQPAVIWLAKLIFTNKYQGNSTDQLLLSISAQSSHLSGHVGEPVGDHWIWGLVNPISWLLMSWLLCKGARTSATMVLTQFPQIIHS